MTSPLPPADGHDDERRDVAWECPECKQTKTLPRGTSPGWHYKPYGGEYSFNACTAPMTAKSEPTAPSVTRHFIRESYDQGDDYWCIPAQPLSFEERVMATLKMEEVTCKACLAGAAEFGYQAGLRLSALTP